MRLEELIYKRFVESESLTSHLATFHGAPAIFSPDPPDNDQEGWEGKVQYPKILYTFDLQANEERHSIGVLSVSLLCQNTMDIVPEMIESTVKDCLRDVILKPGGGTPYCFAWARTDAFTIDENQGSYKNGGEITIGSEIQFDILEYPSQETSDPDPIMAVNQYIKELYPECLVMGYDRMEEITEASREKPVIYSRLLSTELSRETNTVAWMEGKIAIHILCPDSEMRMKMAAAITNRMALDGEVIMLDHSPMGMKHLQVNHKSDYLKEGQIFATGQYGILRYQAKGHTLKRVLYENKRRDCEMTAEKTEHTKDGAGEKRELENDSAKQKESVYTLGELVAGAEAVFGTTPECVFAALKQEGIMECTKSRAEEIVKRFRRKTNY